jgi:hypothetical protein
MENNFQKISGSFDKNPNNMKVERGKWWITAVAVIFCLALVLVWNLYLSPEAKKFHADRANYEKTMSGLATYENAMKNDTYGGKTPQETLDLFVAALEKEDIDLAWKYFLLEEDGSQNLHWKGFLEDIKKSDNMKRFASDIRRYAEFGGSNIENYSGFILKNDKGEIEVQISMFFDRYSGVWKIESL